MRETWLAVALSVGDIPNIIAYLCALYFNMIPVSEDSE